MQVQVLTLILYRLGDNRHVQTYKIDSGKTFIMVMCYPDNDAGMEYGEVDPTSALLHMREEFKDWDPVYV